jgi:hypothetical protein
MKYLAMVIAGIVEWGLCFAEGVEGRLRSLFLQIIVTCSEPNTKNSQKMVLSDTSVVTILKDKARLLDDKNF